MSRGLVLHRSFHIRQVPGQAPQNSKGAADTAASQNAHRIGEQAEPENRRIEVTDSHRESGAWVSILIDLLHTFDRYMCIDLRRRKACVP